MSEVHVTGLKELAQFLDELPGKLQKNVMRGALRAGCNVIKADAKAMCPVSAPSGKNARIYGGYAGALRDSIRVGAKNSGSIVTGYVKAGGKVKGADTYYVRWVEYGARAHTIKAKNGSALSFGGGAVQSILHPGAKPHPFMRPALDGQAAAATVATAEYMKNRLATKEGLDTSEIDIEVEI